MPDNNVEQLINGGTIIKPIRQELTYREVEDSIDNIWSVLYSTGYLTCRRRVPGKKMELVLPNWEVRELFIELVKDWFEETTQADSGRISRSVKRSRPGIRIRSRRCSAIICGIPSVSGIQQCAGT